MVPYSVPQILGSLFLLLWYRLHHGGETHGAQTGTKTDDTPVAETGATSGAHDATSGGNTSTTGTNIPASASGASTTDTGTGTGKDTGTGTTTSGGATLPAVRPSDEDSDTGLGPTAPTPVLVKEQDLETGSYRWLLTFDDGGMDDARRRALMVQQDLREQMLVNEVAQTAKAFETVKNPATGEDTSASVGGLAQGTAAAGVADATAAAATPPVTLAAMARSGYSAAAELKAENAAIAAAKAARSDTSRANAAVRFQTVGYTRAPMRA